MKPIEGGEYLKCNLTPIDRMLHIFAILLFFSQPSVTC